MVNRAVVWRKRHATVFPSPQSGRPVDHDAFFTLAIDCIAEEQPGPRWQALFERHRDTYGEWFLSEGEEARSNWLSSVEKLRQHMPELEPLYDRLCELAGGGDLESRLLSMYRPPAYMTGCSQAVWPGDEPLLVRNYDYSPYLCEGSVLMTRWGERRVIATGDCLWGVLDGLNDAGLAVSLTFGGRRVVGDGFGVPLLLRYVLETCTSTAEAVAALRRVPTHMSYNVTVLDASGAFRTLFLAPDREAVVRQLPAVTNHQGKVEWHRHARATASIERERFLFARLADCDETASGLIDAFLRPPLFSASYGRGYGTLYTAVLRPLSGEIEYRWADRHWRASFDDFPVQTVDARYPMSVPGAQPR